MKPRVRLPFLVALLAAVAVQIVWRMPFSPPDKAAREKASAAGDAPASLAPFLADGLYEPLNTPRPGEWLAVQKEFSQTVADFKNGSYNKPDGTRKYIYLLPMGDFPSGTAAPSLESLREYLEIFFQMPARLAPGTPENAAGATRRVNEGSGKPQLLTTDILKWLPSQLPSDAYCLLAVTLTDLYPKESWNFVFGEATFKERVGVFSLARNDPDFEGRSGIDRASATALMLRRACLTLSHETGHMFGWKHCRFYRCLMGGSMSLGESDRTPAALCPVCLHKLAVTRTFDPSVRQQQLIKFYRQHHLGQDEQAAMRVLKTAAPETIP